MGEKYFAESPNRTRNDSLNTRNRLLVVSNSHPKTMSNLAVINFYFFAKSFAVLVNSVRTSFDQVVMWGIPAICTLLVELLFGLRGTAVGHVARVLELSDK